MDHKWDFPADQGDVSGQGARAAYGKAARLTVAVCAAAVTVTSPLARAQGPPTASVGGTIDVSVARPADGEAAEGYTLYGDLAVAPDGDVFVAQAGSNLGGRVLRIATADQTVHWFAGSGERMSSGDGGSALEAGFAEPRGTTVGADGSVYVADRAARVVRRIDPAGVISTVAGTGLDGDVEEGPARQVDLAPIGLALDGAGDLYILSDPDGPTRLSRLDMATGSISTVVATSYRPPTPRWADGERARDAGVRSIEGWAVDAEGNVYIADRESDLIRRVDASTNVLSTVIGAQNQPGLGGTFGDLAITPDGEELFGVAGRQIYAVDPRTGGTSVVAGNGTPDWPIDGVLAANSPFRNIWDLELTDDGSLLIQTGEGIFAIGDDGVLHHAAGTTDWYSSGDGGPAEQATMGAPTDVSIDQTGNIYVADLLGGRIRRIDARTGTITSVVERDAYGTNIRFVQVDDGGNRLFYLDEHGGIYQVDLVSGLREKIHQHLPAGGIAVDGDTLYITSYGRIERLDLVTGEVSRVAGLDQPGTSGDGGPATSAAVSPTSNAVIAPDRDLYFADTDNETRVTTIRRIAAGTGVIDRVAGGGPVALPERGDSGPATLATLGPYLRLAIDADENIYIAEALESRVRRIVNDTQVIERVAGNGTAGPCGDGGPALDACLDNLYGHSLINHTFRFEGAAIALAPDGDLVIAAPNTGQLRVVQAPLPAAPPPPIARLDPASSSEGNTGTSTLTASITLNRASPIPVRLELEIAGGTATLGQDYQLPADWPAAVLPANQLSVTVPLTIIGDTTYEPPETIAIRLTSADHATVDTAPATLTITNDDPAPPRYLTIGAWASQGGGTLGSPAAASNQPYSATLFVRGTDNQLWVRTIGAGTTNYRPLGGRITDGVAATATRYSTSAFTRGADGALWEHQCTTAVTCGTWRSLGGVIRSTPAATSNGQRTDVFARGGDDQLWQRTRTGTTWGPWTRLGGRLGSGPTATWTGTNRLTVAARGADGAIWYREMTNGTWGHWTYLGGSPVDQPAVAHTADGATHLVIRGTDNSLWETVRDATGIWSPFRSHGGHLTSAPSATAVATNAAPVVLITARGRDGAVWAITGTTPGPS